MVKSGISPCVVNFFVNLESSPLCGHPLWSEMNIGVVGQRGGGGNGGNKGGEYEKRRTKIDVRI